MQFNEYESKTRETAVYPGALKGGMDAIAYLALGLGEAGEVQGKVKKILRDNDGLITSGQRVAIAAELGDLLWYVTRLSDELGVGVELIAKMNVDKLASRKERGVLGGSGDER